MMRGRDGDQVEVDDDARQLEPADLLPRMTRDEARERIRRVLAERRAVREGDGSGRGGAT